MMLSTVHSIILLMTLVSCLPLVSGNEHICKNTTNLLCDPDKVLTKENAVQLLTTIDGVNNDSVCVCSNCTHEQNGYIMAVTVVIQIDSEVDGLSFADNLRHDWLFSKTICNDSVLVMYSNNDEKPYIVMGEPIASRVPNSTIEELYKDCHSIDSVVGCLEHLVIKLDEAIKKATEEMSKDDNLIWGILGFIAIITILGFHYYIKY